MPLLCFSHNLNLSVVNPMLRQGLELLDCAEVGVRISHRWNREHKVLLRFLLGREFNNDATQKGKSMVVIQDSTTSYLMSSFPCLPSEFLCHCMHCLPIQVPLQALNRTQQINVECRPSTN